MKEQHNLYSWCFLVSIIFVFFGIFLLTYGLHSAKQGAGFYPPYAGMAILIGAGSIPAGMFVFVKCLLEYKRLLHKRIEDQGGQQSTTPPHRHFEIFTDLFLYQDPQSAKPLPLPVLPPVFSLPGGFTTMSKKREDNKRIKSITATFTPIGDLLNKHVNELQSLMDDLRGLGANDIYIWPVDINGIPTTYNGQAIVLEYPYSQQFLKSVSIMVILDDSNIEKAMRLPHVISIKAVDTKG